MCDDNERKKTTTREEDLRLLPSSKPSRVSFREMHAYQSDHVAYAYKEKVLAR